MGPRAFARVFATSFASPLWLVDHWTKKPEPVDRKFSLLDSDGEVGVSPQLGVCLFATVMIEMVVDVPKLTPGMSAFYQVRDSESFLPRHNE